MTLSVAQTWRDANILLPHGAVEKVHLVLHSGKIAEIVPGDLPAPLNRVEADMSGYLVTPGLVNAHDHLDFNCFPPCAPNSPYDNATSWYTDVRAAGHAQTLREVKALPRVYRLLAGGFKNLLSGATTVAHHDPPVRAVHLARFPVTVPRVVGYCHSLATDSRPARSLPRDPGRPWVIHAAEGTDSRAAGEVAKLEELGCLRPGSILVHCLGIDRAGDPDRLAAAGASVVWCPSSNHCLYQATAPVPILLQRSRVALGTDSTISGGRGMLDELRAARRAEPDLPLRTILAMATSTGADMFRLSPARGAITSGAIADLALFRLPAGPADDPLLAPFEAQRPALVVRDGVPLLAEAAFRHLLEALKLAPASFSIGGHDLWMPRRVHRLFARTVTATRGWPPFGDSVDLHSHR